MNRTLSSPTPRHAPRRTLAAVASAGLIAGLGIAAAAAPAQATPGPVQYTVSGNLLYGQSGAFSEAAPAGFIDPVAAGSFTGSFVFDLTKCPSTPCPSAYSQVSISTTAAEVAWNRHIYPFAQHTYTNADVTPTFGEVASDSHGLVLWVPAAEPDPVPISVPKGVQEKTSFPSFALVLLFDTALGAPGTVTVTPRDSGEIQRGAMILTSSPARTVGAGTAVGVQPEFRIGAASAKTRLARAGKKTLVRSATNTPAGAGAIKSISVRCTVTTKKTRGDVTFCKAKKSLATGKVVVRTYGVKGVRVTVTIKKVSTWAGFPDVTWTRTWRVR